MGEVVKEYILDLMCSARETNVVELTEHPDVVGMYLHIKLAPDCPYGQIDEMPLPPIGGVMLAEVTVVIDQYPIQKDPHSLIGGGEKKALVCPRIGRNVDANPDVVRPLGYGDTKLWVEFPPAPLVFREGRNAPRRPVLSVGRV